MKKWRVVRVNKRGSLDVADVGYWTKVPLLEAALELARKDVPITKEKK